MKWDVASLHQLQESVKGRVKHIMHLSSTDYLCIYVRNLPHRRSSSINTYVFPLALHSFANNEQNVCLSRRRHQKIVFQLPGVAFCASGIQLGFLWQSVPGMSQTRSLPVSNSKQNICQLRKAPLI